VGSEARHDRVLSEWNRARATLSQVLGLGGDHSERDQGLSFEVSSAMDDSGPGPPDFPFVCEATVEASSWLRELDHYSPYSADEGTETSLRRAGL
jgi:hypothetical protein